MKILDEELMTSSDKEKVTEEGTAQSESVLQPIDFDVQGFENFLIENENLIFDLFNVIIVVPKSQITDQDIDLRYDNFHEVRN